MLTYEQHVQWEDAKLQIKRRLSLPDLLREERVKIRGRGRADCPFCDGSQRGTMVFTQELFKCHRCGAGGDIFTFIEMTHGGDFKRALDYAARLARVELPTAKRLSREERRQFALERVHHRRVGEAAVMLKTAERDLRLWYRDLIHRCEQKQTEVRQRMAGERWQGEFEGWWGWLAVLHSLLRDYLAAYSVLSFGCETDRARFTLKPALRQAMITRALLEGFVDDHGKWREVLE
jgi:hypothetical protein